MSFLFWRKSVQKPNYVGYKGLPFPHQYMSHRGGALEFIENTMPGFRYSGNVLKSDILELDVMETLDGEVVIFHDDEMGRLCGPEYNGKSINDFLYKELPLLAIPDCVKNNSDLLKNPDARRIPRLRELFDEFPQYPMQIDVKKGSETLVIKVGDMIHEYKRAHSTVWGSFHAKQKQWCFRHFGDRIPLFMDIPRFLKAYWLHFFGLLWLMDIYEKALIMPNVNLYLKKSFFRAMNERGVSIIVYGRINGGMNTEAEWIQTRHAGANGICADNPTAVHEWLKTHPMDKIVPSVASNLNSKVHPKLD